MSAKEDVVIVPPENKDFKTDLNILIKAFENKFIEREDHIRISLLGLFTKQHIFLIGEPGVGKTYFCSLVTSSIRNSNFWQIQMTSETGENKLLGLDQTGESSLTNSEYVLLDEMYKGNPQTLSSLLSLLNERYYTVNGKAINVQLMSAFGASNEFPVGEMVKAFDDRFMFRMEMKRIQSRQNMKKFIHKEFDTSSELPVYFEIDDIEYCLEKAKEIKITDEFDNIYLNLIENTTREGVKCSDRKFGYSIAILKMSAFLNGRDKLDKSDLFIMEHIAWANYTDRANFRRILYETMFGNKNVLIERLKNIQTDVTKLISLKNSDFSDVLQHKVEFNGRASEDNFNIVKENVSALAQRLAGQLDNMNEIVGQYNEIMELEKQINENIFLMPIHNKIFTQEIATEIANLFEHIQKNKDECEEWVLANRTLYLYNEKYYD